MDEDRLAAWLARARPDWAKPTIGEVTKLQAGWESDVYRIVLTHGPDGSRTCEHLVVRLYVGSQGSHKASNEFRGMQLLCGAGYPVPRVIAVEPNPDTLGRPFMVMDFVDGDAEWSWSALEDEARRSTFVGLLNRLHLVDWRPFVDASLHADLAAGLGVERTLAEWRVYLEEFPILGFARLLEWLEASLPTLPRLAPAVVHWDFHVGNVLVSDDNRAWVVDWTQVGVTDPRFDVAWTGLLMTQSRGHDVVRGEYEATAGPLPGMEFFDMAAAMRRLSTIVISLEAGPEAMGMRPEASGLMRDQIPTLADTYERVQDVAGIDLPSVEALLP